MDERNIIVHPQKGKRELAVPENGLFFVTPVEAKRAHELVEKSGGTRRFFYNSRLSISAGEKFFVAGPAVGSPMAAMTMEKLIALGARSIVMYGWCGATTESLQVGDVLVGSRAVSGEGTSRYYPNKPPVKSSDTLSRHLQMWLSENDILSSPGVVWTTDAPYREDREMLAQLRSQDGVQVVDMEYSALCSVGMFRNIDFSAILLVSDELYHKDWKHGFRQAVFKDTNQKLVELLCHHFF